ncbi:substrate-binding domain-containing protein [Pseudonocardia sp. ICBG162]|uniref:substrate-binding domain-containing protein n=1 Tax=Pseudonocardia sp. ICBG162 TaxID=2846761 RepID=UPI001CF6EBE1|nr:substrate-binding domain-containing protein [Pseudonocardia sp. ICBG162]
MVVPRQGPAGLFGPSCEAIAELAMEEINAAGGVLGREVTLEFVDGGAAPRRTAREVSRLIDDGRADAVTGWHISSVRNALAPVVAGRIPYAYTALYEGGETRDGIFCSGEIPRQQIAPALRWLRDNLGARRWFVVGNDFEWPHRSMVEVRRFAHDLDLRLCGTAFVPLGSGRARGLVRRVEAADCDGVLMLLVGGDAVEFNRQFAARGLHERLVRFTPMTEENMLLASGSEATRNLFVCSAYFRSLVNGDAMDLLGRYQRMHGTDAPALNVVAESCYEGLTTLANLVRRAGSTELRDLNAVVDGAAYHGPRGTVEFHGQQAHQHVHLAAVDGYDFDVITRL